MRAALVWLLVILTFGTARADDVESGIRAQLAAQGYAGIEITPKGDQLLVHAQRDKLVVDNIYDAATGQLVSERVHQADDAKAAQ